MIIEQYYINQNPSRTQADTGLALDEIEGLVGRFRAHSCRAGLLRGKVTIMASGEIQIRKCFGQKILWRTK